MARPGLGLCMSVLFCLAVVSLHGLGEEEGGGGPSWTCSCRLEVAGARGGGVAAGSSSLELSAQSGPAPAASDPGGAFFSVSEETAQTLCPVLFDASASRGLGGIALYEWDWEGDGVFDEGTTEPRIKHSYAEDGSYLVSVRISDAAGLSTISAPQEIVILNRAPVVVPQASAFGADEDEPIVFSAGSSDPDGFVASLTWDFGDGEASSSAECTHAFQTAGVYEVHVVLTDNDGATTESAPLVISVRNPPPTASFRVEETAAGEGYSVLFLDTSTDPTAQAIIHVAWDFGDGTYRAGGPEKGGRYPHTYANPGVYVVTLYVIDAAGAMASVRGEVRISG